MGEKVNGSDEWQSFLGCFTFLSLSYMIDYILRILIFMSQDKKKMCLYVGMDNHHPPTQYYSISFITDMILD